MYWLSTVHMVVLVIKIVTTHRWRPLPESFKRASPFSRFSRTVLHLHNPHGLFPHLLTQTQLRHVCHRYIVPFAMELGLLGRYSHRSLIDGQVFYRPHKEEKRQEPSSQVIYRKDNFAPFLYWSLPQPDMHSPGEHQRRNDVNYESH